MNGAISLMQGFMVIATVAVIICFWSLPLTLVRNKSDMSVWDVIGYCVVCWFFTWVNWVVLMLALRGSSS